MLTDLLSVTGKRGTSGTRGEGSYNVKGVHLSSNHYQISWQNVIGSNPASQEENHQLDKIPNKRRM